MIDIDPHILTLFEFRNRKGDLKKIEIIQAAIEVLAEVGLENTTYEALALKINSRRAHVAYHFDDKKKIFLAAVKYILGEFQQSILTSIEAAKDNGQGHAKEKGAPLLHAYIDGVFDWARTSPQQVQIMLMLYYQCTLDKDYLNLHDEVRQAGAERLSYLFLKLPEMKKERSEKLAKTLQNYLSGTLMDVFTTKSAKLLEAQDKSHKFLDLLIKADFF